MSVENTKTVHADNNRRLRGKQKTGEYDRGLGLAVGELLDRLVDRVQLHGHAHVAFDLDLALHERRLRVQLPLRERDHVVVLHRERHVGLRGARDLGQRRRAALLQVQEPLGRGRALAIPVGVSYNKCRQRIRHRAPVVAGT